jgi:hypothetical protein
MHQNRICVFVKRNSTLEGIKAVSKNGLHEKTIAATYGPIKVDQMQADLSRIK